MADNLKAKRFIEAYNRLDQGAREIYNIKRSMSFSDMIRQTASISPVIKKYKETLIDYARLRNAIVHNNSNDEIIAEPNEDIVEKMESIARLVTTPPRVIDSIAARSVFSVTVDTKLSYILSELYKSGYSVVPVYDKNNLVGVINRKMLLDAIGKCAMDQKSIDGFVSLPISECLNILEVSSHYEVVPASITIDNMLYLFQQNRKLGVVVITKNGNYNEEAVGVVVTSDTIEMQTILDKY